MTTKPPAIPTGQPVALGVDVTSEPTEVAIVDLTTGGIVRMLPSEIAGLDPETFRRATARDIAIAE